MHAGRIVLHLKSVIWHYSAPRFSDMQGGIKELDNKYFGSSLVNFSYFFFHLLYTWLKSILLITRVSQLTYFLMKVSVKQSVNWVRLKEIISRLRLNFQS